MKHTKMCRKNVEYLNVFENMVLRRIFRPRRDEVTGEWRRSHNEELNDLYSSPNIVKSSAITGLNGPRGFVGS